jgi:hypothetical protein
LSSYDKLAGTPSVQPSRLGLVRAESDREFERVTVEIPAPMPWQTVALLIAQDAGLSLALGADAAGEVQIAVTDVPADDALRQVGELVGLVPVFEGDSVRFVNQDDAARGIAVLAPGVTSAAAVVEVLQLALPGAEAVAVDGRVAVAGDRQLLEAATGIVGVLQGGRDGWIVDVRLMSVSDSLASQVGLGTSLDGEASLLAGVAATDGGPFVADVGAGVDVAARVIMAASETSSAARLVTTGTLYVMEGGTGSLNQGDSVPIPLRVTSPEGTVTTTGYQFVDTGFIVDVAAFRLEDGRVMLNVVPEVSNVTGFVEEAPQVQRSTVNATLVLAADTWGIVSGLEGFGDVRSGEGLPGRSSSLFGGLVGSQRTTDRLLVLVRARRITASS